jgi:hypothetical protein
VAVLRVGDRQRVPAAVGLRGQHEPDTLEHLGRRALPRAHLRLGAFYDVARTLIEREAFVLVTPAPHYLEVAKRWVHALLDVYTERTELAGALEAAATDIDELVARDDM